MTAMDLAALDLPQLFTPKQAAEILRNLGLPEMTECALRTRAYRRQVPFHFNGRRIRFTVTDLREIVEGQAHRPLPVPVQDPASGTTPWPLPPRRRSTARRPTRSSGDQWRARTPHQLQTDAGRRRAQAKPQEDR